MKKLPKLTEDLLNEPIHNLGTVSKSVKLTWHMDGGVEPITGKPHQHLAACVLQNMNLWTREGGYEVALSLSLDGCDVNELP
jgi:hypothetical protein